MEPIAFDMSRSQRIIATANSRVKGEFKVFAGNRENEFWIHPIDLTIYDETFSYGSTYGRRDFTANVEDGVPSLSFYDVRIKPELDEVNDELMLMLTLVAKAFSEGMYSEVSETEVRKPGTQPEPRT